MNEAYPWMRKILIAAAIYNLIWGTWVVLRPNDLFTLTGISPPVYLGIWQCVGMIVGVYGVGYAIAASNPIRHWPITLVGLLGKILGPIGFVSTVATVGPADPGYLPLSWGWTIVTNDLIWWAPFIAILYVAFKESTASSEPDDVMRVSHANEIFLNQHGQSIADLSRQSPLLVLFLRHSGCTFCREALADLRDKKDKLKQQGVLPVLVYQSDSEAVMKDLEHYGLTDCDHVSDPGCELYRAYGLRRGTLGQLFGPDVWWRGFKAAILSRHGVGKLDGDGFQMPGAFLVENNRIVEAYRHQAVSDRPDVCQIARRDY
ncbi:SelL-related redox protein [Rubripirellula amarantea]|nr:SelL-related redox protein [Rubripirellula amarantea]